MIVGPQTRKNDGQDKGANSSRESIRDFGEKLEGARKDMPPSLKEKLGDDQIASQPLSKIWPADAHESIENDFVAALAFAARAEVPAKPRTPYKVRAWVNNVKKFREIVHLYGDPQHKEALEREAENKRHDQFGRFVAKVKLLEQLPRDTWKHIGAVLESPDGYRYSESGERVPSPMTMVEVNGKRIVFNVGRIGTNEVTKIKDVLSGATPKSEGLTAKDFEIRRNSNTGVVFVNRKGDGEYRHLKEFTGDDAVKQARAWLDSSVAEAEAAWESVKARDNVSKSDTRMDDNRERIGRDWRGGKDATPEMFDAAFQFRGVQFGNWVAQGSQTKGRQAMLNDAYDALHDLADVLGIPTQAVSLNGGLGLAFGARGSGKAAAHFERNNLVINLTKTRGAGSLAHEWFHALDNYFSRQRNGDNPDGAEIEKNYIT